MGNAFYLLPLWQLQKLGQTPSNLVEVLLWERTAEEMYLAPFQVANKADEKKGLPG